MLKYELLKYLKSSGDYVSGESLGELLGVSRAAVWKEIKSLRNDGYEIEAVTNRGYILKGTGDVFNPSEINTSDYGCLIGKNVICYDVVDSTNTVCKNMAYGGLEEGSVIAAESQSDGVGRLGRNWVSKEGGLYMSILLKPDIEPVKLPAVTLTAGLAVCKALNEFGFEADIKWPNDILINKKKVCGILTEMSGQLQKVDFIVVGIGININIKEFPSDVINKATSLFIESGKKFKRSEVAKTVLINFDKVYKKFISGGFEDIKDDYEKNCINIGKRVKVIGRNGDFEATAVEVTSEGELIVLRDDGQRQKIFSGEVSVRGVY